MLNWRRPFGGRRGVVAPEIKDSRTGPLIALTSAGRPRWTPRDYANLATEGFGRNAVAYRCVRMVAEAAASTPLAVFVDGARRDDHPLARLLAQPNPEQSGTEWLEALYGGLQTAGNAYAEAVGDDTPAELWTLRPDRVKVVPGRGGWPEAYEYSVDGRSLRIGRQADGWMPVMQLKLFHPTDDHYGFSPLEAAASAIDVHNASSAWNKALLDNAARPSGALVYGAKDGERLTVEQFEALRAQLDETHAGTMNAGRPMILEGGLDWKPMSWTPADMDFIAGKHAAAREIALAFGVAPQLLGIPGDAILLKIEGAMGVFTTVAGLRARTISLNARSVDATDGDSAGRWRELLGGAGVKSAAVAGQGIFRDAASDALIREAFFDQAARTWRLIVPDFGTLEGPFLVAALEYAGEHEGEATFAISLASAGEVTFGAP